MRRKCWELKRLKFYQKKMREVKWHNVWQYLNRTWRNQAPKRCDHEVQQGMFRNWELLQLLLIDIKAGAKRQQGYQESVQEWLIWEFSWFSDLRETGQDFILLRGQEEATVEHSWLIEILAHKVGTWVTPLLASKQTELWIWVDGILSPQNRHLVLL